MKIPLVSAVTILTAVVENRENASIVWQKEGGGFVEEEQIERVLSVEDAYGLKADLERENPELRGKLSILPVTGGASFVESFSRLSEVMRERMTAKPFGSVGRG